MTSIASPNPQITFDFEPSLPERFTSLRSYIAYRVQEQRLNAANLAGKMDLSPSVLSRKLNQPDGDTQRLNVDDLEAYVRETKDVHSVIEYLAAKYLDSEASRKTRALARVEALLAELTSAAASLKAST